ncbi:MAG: PQQ-binding-like beta-propeller repeat protein [Acidimicrobiales bacterium]
MVLVPLLWGCSAITGGGSSDSSSKVVQSAPGSGGQSAGTIPPAKTGLAPKPKQPYAGWVDPKSSGQPWSTKVVGQLTFRGNPTRSYYGLGPLPKDPKVLGGTQERRHVRQLARRQHAPQLVRVGVDRRAGRLGRPEGQTWLAVGTYDKHIHFIDSSDGSDILEPFDMGDIIKGSVTKDPDGYPLLYSGSRADFHILGLDRPGAAADLWSMSADNVSPVNGWNDDWDSSPLVIDDYLFEGGENGQWYIIKLNRGKGADGLVTVDPKIVFHAPGWDDQLTSDLAGSGARRKDTSIENSLAISGNTVYFANSGGLVQGWDITDLKKDPNSVKRVFRFWTGDDTDASVVVDEQGYLYVASERERSSSFTRDDEVGQLMKLDPRKPDDPLVWKVNDPATNAPPPSSGDCAESACYGIWGTPAIYDGVVYAATNHGRVLAVDQESGKVLWEKKLPGPTWQSPVVVDDTLILGDCSGVLHAYDVSKPGKDPAELWNVELEGCIESTPAVFKGKLFVGARGGAFYAIGDE